MSYENLSTLTFSQKMFRTLPIKKVYKMSRRPSSIVEDDSGQLVKTLGLIDLIAFGISSAVGSGIFVIAGTAGSHSGAGLFLAFIIAGISCLFSGLCYAEFSTRVPVAGSAYTYSYCSLGEIVGFLIGWDLTLEYSISAAAVAQSWASYFQTFLEGCHIGDKYLPDIWFGRSLDSIFSVNILAGVLICICTALLIYGIRESATFTNFITAWNVTIIVFYVIAGSFFVDTNNWTHPCDNTSYGTYCTSSQSNSMFPEGFRGLFRASGMVFFSYVGFDAVTCLAEETIDPQKQMVRGILGTLLIITVLYCAVSLVLAGMVPFTAFDSSAPLAQAFTSHKQNTLSTLVSLGALTTTAATTLTSLIGQPRIFLRMAHDGLFFPIFKKIHPKYKTPAFGSLISGIFALMLAVTINFDILADMISIGTLIAYILVCGGVIVLRYPNNTKLFGGKNLAIYVSIYVICTLSLGFAIDNVTSINSPLIYVVYTLVIIIGIMFGGFIFISNNIKPKVNINKIYLCPYVPYLPALGILINSYMIASLKWESFARVIVWFMIGFSVYYFYGSEHSELNAYNYNNSHYQQQQEEENENENEEEERENNGIINRPEISFQREGTK